ncbi:NAD-dependent protein deacylase sirtuin-5, mitochondrial isoform X1 [Pseudorasbora parva]|uniref:NAD-dependent protein deacylase sirtuin-5, mitochondrial isoform X1 n=1 Tax=Pseudorasbora parva TaxID=51549 RepID=UPI00351E2ACE
MMLRAVAHCGRWTAFNQLTRRSSDMAEFREVFSKARQIAIITGAGVSAESGVPTIRGAEGRWRTWKTQDLATPQSFCRHTSRVWEFYHYRRELTLNAQPSTAHIAIAECEARLSRQGRSLVVITQNIDELHQRAGSKRVLEVHGNQFQTRCVSCGNVEVNHKSPICPSLEGKGSPDPDVPDALIPVKDLPRCHEKGCDGLLRPHVIWFGETLDSHILTKVEKELETCDLCLVVGTSSVVYPAAVFGPQVASRGVPVAEFNTKMTPNTARFSQDFDHHIALNLLLFHFPGRCAATLPAALARHESELI